MRGVSAQSCSHNFSPSLKGTGLICSLDLKYKSDLPVKSDVARGKIFATKSLVQCQCARHKCFSKCDEHAEIKTCNICLSAPKRPTHEYSIAVKIPAIRRHKDGASFLFSSEDRDRGKSSGGASTDAAVRSDTIDSLLRNVATTKTTTTTTTNAKVYTYDFVQPCEEPTVSGRQDEWNICRWSGPFFKHHHLALYYTDMAPGARVLSVSPTSDRSRHTHIVGNTLTSTLLCNFDRNNFLLVQSERES